MGRWCSGRLPSEFMSRKTVYILGAGFSKLAGYPLGGEIGREIIEDPMIIQAGKNEFPPPRIFQKAMDAYRQHVKTMPGAMFEEIWMSIEGIVNQPGRMTGEDWAIKYFRFAISESFLKVAAQLHSFPSSYVNFFKGIQRDYTYARSDSILYMNWDPLPELYCGLCYTTAGQQRATPAFRPLGISSEDTNIRVSSGVQVLRPAGGIHLVELPDGGTLQDRYGREDNDRFSRLTNRPSIFLLKDLSRNTLDAIRTQVGDNYQFMVYPGTDPSHHSFSRGQLDRAETEITQADRIIVVGYRFPSYDKYIRERLEKLDYSRKEIIVVDPQEEAAQYIRDRWQGGNKLHLEKEKFENSFLSKQNWNPE